MGRVFITGATGFLGSHFVKALYSAGYDIVALIRSPSNELRKFEDKLKTIILPDVRYQDFAQVLKDGFDFVCHLAAFIPDNHLDASFARLCFESNVMLTLNLLQASLRNGIKRFLYFSAGNAYSQDLETPAREHDQIYPSQISPFYLGSKILAEIYVEHFRHQYSLDAISLRISSPYGIGMLSKSAVMAFIRRTLEGLPLKVQSGGQYKADFVFVKDVVDVAAASLNSGTPGIYNIGSGVSTSILELAHTVSEVFERDIPIDVIFENSKPNIGFGPLDIQKAKTTWNWYPRPLKDGLRAMRAALEYGQE